MTAAAGSGLDPHLPATLRLGPVHLTISTLDGSIAFYERALGLRLHDRDGAVATLGAGAEDLVVLVERSGWAEPEPRAFRPARRGPPERDLGARHGAVINRAGQR